MRNTSKKCTLNGVSGKIIFLQLIQRMNFHSNWKILHRRLYMVWSHQLSHFTRTSNCNWITRLKQFHFSHEAIFKLIKQKLKYIIVIIGPFYLINWKLNMIITRVENMFCFQSKWSSRFEEKINRIKCWCNHIICFALLGYRWDFFYCNFFCNWKTTFANGILLHQYIQNEIPGVSVNNRKWKNFICILSKQNLTAYIELLNRCIFDFSTKKRKKNLKKKTQLIELALFFN